MTVIHYYFSIKAIVSYIVILLVIRAYLSAIHKFKKFVEYITKTGTYGMGVVGMAMLVTYLVEMKKVLCLGGYDLDSKAFCHILCILLIVSSSFMFITRHYIAPKIHAYQAVGYVTVPQIIGNYYGQKARVCIGIIAFLYCSVMIILQVISLEYLGNFIYLPPGVASIGGSFLLIIYSIQHGKKVAIITGLVLLAANILVYNKSQYAQNIFIPITLNGIPPCLKDYVVHCKWFTFSAFPLSFSFIQYILMNNDKRQWINSYYLFVSFTTSLCLILILMVPTLMVSKTIEGTNMPIHIIKLIYLIKTYFPIGIRVIVGTGYRFCCCNFYCTYSSMHTQSKNRLQNFFQLVYYYSY